MAAIKIRETMALISELCRQFYQLGWVSGTGGSITVKVHNHSIPKSHQLIVISPSGVQKERIMDEDMYVLSPDGSVLYEPLPKPWPHKPPKCSDCGPVFMKAYEMCNAGAVIHSHGMESCLVTMINPSSKEFRITHMEMIKGIQGHGYYDELVVPIIENTAHERELTDSLAEAIKAYPKTTAVLVRNHGVFVWGDSWIIAKTHAECYHYLFDAAIKLHQLGLDWSTPSHGPIHSQSGLIGSHRNADMSVNARTFSLNNGIEPSRRCILLEGTMTPITFRMDGLVPYACDNVAVVFGDVPEALKKWHSLGIKVYIYSSSSRLTQRLLFGNTNYGDLRKYLSGFFDTTVGNKKERKSYIEITECLGVNSPREILFVTDAYREAMAAKDAGFEVIIVIRPGNGPLPDNHGFRTINSFSDIVDGL